MATMHEIYKLIAHPYSKKHGKKARKLKKDYNRARREARREAQKVRVFGSKIKAINTDDFLEELTSRISVIVISNRDYCPIKFSDNHTTTVYGPF